MWVSTRNARSLPSPVVVGGVTYPGSHATRCWRFNDNNQLIDLGFVQLVLARDLEKEVVLLRRAVPEVIGGAELAMMTVAISVAVAMT